MRPILPDVKLALLGEDGNAFSILGRAQRAMRRAGHADRIAEFKRDATSGDYDHLLQACFRWFDVDGGATEPGDLDTGRPESTCGCCGDRFRPKDDLDYCDRCRLDAEMDR